MKKKFMCMLMAAAMTLSMAACGSKSDDTNTDDNAGGASDGVQTFTVGTSGPLTGDNAIYGMAVKQGVELAVNEINASDSTIKFEFLSQDDEADGEKAVNAYNTLKDWGMQLSVGSVTSKPCEATSAETYADRIFALTPSASSVAVLEGKDNQFQICFIDPNQGAASAQYIFDKKLGTKVAVIWKNDDVYSKGIYETFMQKAKELGLKVVSDTTFADGNDTDFSVQLTDAQNNGADLIFLPMYYQPASVILSQANAMGYAPTFFGVDGMDGILTMEGFDASLAEGVMLLTPFNADATDEKTQSFVTKYQELYGDVPNQFAADAYDCVYVIKAAAEKEDVTPDKSVSDICDALKKGMTEITYDGLTGKSITWSEDGEPTKDPTVVVVKSGEYQVLQAEDAAE